MPNGELILIQSDASPYDQILDQALRQTQATTVERVRTTADLGQMAQAGPALVIWDVSNCEDMERDSLALLITLAQVGVMLVCPAVDATVQALLGRIDPLAILVDPQSVHQVAACLEVALATHRRVLALGRELAQLRDQLQDRMLVERAKRVLMEARGLTEGQAMADLQAYSRRSNHKLVTVARKILAAYRVFNGLHEGEPNPGDEVQG